MLQNPALKPETGWYRIQLRTGEGIVLKQVKLSIEEKRESVFSILSPINK